MRSVHRGLGFGPKVGTLLAISVPRRLLGRLNNYRVLIGYFEEVEAEGEGVVKFEKLTFQLGYVSGFEKREVEGGGKGWSF